MSIETKIYFDTEFNEFGGALISIGMIAEDGEQFYEVLEMHEEPGAWVAANVMPILGKEPLPKSVVQNRLLQFLNRYRKVHFICDWPDDIKYLCEFIMTGPGTMMLLNKQHLTFTVKFGVDYSSRIPHHALEDALAIKRAIEG